MRKHYSTLIVVLITVWTALPIAADEGFVVDHRHVVLFDRIPPQYLEEARNLGMLFSDRSVGVNTDEALNCLTATSWPDSRASCRRDYYDEWNWKTYSESDWLAGRVPDRILFDPSPSTYDRSNWTFEIRSGSWESLTCDFVDSLVPTYLPSKNVLSYQFSYLNVMEGDDIADPETGFFADRPEHCDIGDVEELISQNPDKTFVFWTTSLARSIGTDVSTDFNNMMRDYCLANDRILFDFADIESHTDDGNPCFDNRDGVPYQSASGASENHPDDGFDYPAICQDYTTEVDGGHLGSVSGGGIRVGKGLWVLMAGIAGWDPFNGDLDDNGMVDAADHAIFADCMSGPGVTEVPAPCHPADFVRCDLDADNDVDLADFTVFTQQVM